DAPAVGGLGGTYAGNPLACAAALATIGIMERDDYASKARVLGQELNGRFQQWVQTYPIVREVRGIGAMMAVEIVQDKQSCAPGTALTADIVERAYQQGLILVKAGFYGNVLRFLGPLNMEVSQLNTGLDILERSIAAVCGVKLEEATV